MNYYERHLGDYARDTAHLSMLEHGAYGLLLDRYYTTEAGIPADQAHRLARARTRDEKAAVDTVLAEFFTLADGVWTKGRVEQEIEKAQTKIKAAKANGLLGGRPKGNQAETQKKPTGLLPGSETETQEKALQSPVSSLQSPIEEGKTQAMPAAHARRSKQSRMPEDFCASDRVRQWAQTKGYGHLDEHLDAFRRKVAANGYTAASWDDKFMEAIREDWAKLRGRSSNGAAPPPEHTAPSGPDPELERLRRQAAQATPIPAAIRDAMARLKVAA